MIDLELEKVVSGPSLAKGSSNKEKSKTTHEVHATVGYNESEGINANAEYISGC